MKILKDKAEIIISNLSPLLGCKQKRKGWSPRTGSQICKNLQISSLLCMDMEKEKYQRGVITYNFDNKISIQTSNIYKYARLYSSLVFDSSYGIQVQDIPYLSDKSSQVFLQSLSSRYNDSAIMDILEDKKSLALTPVYKHLLLVLLESFSIRYSLYEFVYEGVELPYTEINSKHIKKVIDNLIYVRVKLEEFDSKETIELNHHLSTLLLNLKMIEKEISRRFVKI